MRISLNAGGLGGVAVAGFQADTASLIDQVDSLIIGFVAVKHQTRNLNGGAGQLQGALECMQARINAETARRDAAIAAQEKAGGFLALAMRIDGQVAAAVQKNKEEFYQINPWLKPASDKPWHENAWNDICTLWDDTGDFLKKAWDGLMEWCSSNVGRIVLGVLAVVGAVLLVVAIIGTGGLALVPLLCAWGVSASVAATISLTVAGIALVSTAVAFLPNTFDLIAAVDEVIDPSSNSFSDWNNSLHQMGWYNTVQRVANITGAVSGGLYSIGNLYNLRHGITPADLKNIKNQAFPKGGTSGGVGSGRLNIVEGGNYSASEINAAEYMRDLGNDVTLRPPTGTRAGGGTSDLVVNGMNYDVYTPTTSNPSRIIGSIAAKNSQATGIVLDLSKTSVTIKDLGDILSRIQGAVESGGKVLNIKDIVIIPK